jgi:hypothetical protein
MFKPKPLLIEFGVNDYRLTPPKPAKGYIPEWYKKSPKYRDHSDQQKVGSHLRENNKGIKYCMPFLDTLTHGYMAELWCDVQIYRTPTGPEIHWEIEPTVLAAREPEGMEQLPIPAGHLGTHFVWKNPYSIKTPPGYSVLITHPLNRFDLPFTTLSGISDADSFMPPGNLPFYLQEDFEGIIPAGTPIFQIIPIKRENWTSSLNKDLYELGQKRIWKSLAHTGFYKDNLWTKKNFE